MLTAIRHSPISIIENSRVLAARRVVLSVQFAFGHRSVDNELDHRANVEAKPFGAKPLISATSLRFVFLSPTPSRSAPPSAPDLLLFASIPLLKAPLPPVLRCALRHRFAALQN